MVRSRWSRASGVVVGAVLAAAVVGRGAGEAYGSGSTLSTIATFNRSNGSSPRAELIADASGNLYGTTQDGGDYDRGIVFEVAAGTHALSTVVTFHSSIGTYPEARLLADASGNFYGTTQAGGANDKGTVFKVSAGTHALTTLATFNGNNGTSPQAGLIADASGNLYGTTWSGGGANCYGTVFEVAVGTHALTTLATFSGSYGLHPDGELIADANGNLYGTTSSGASNSGTVFKVAAGTHVLTTLATFNNDGSYGTYPIGALLADASGNLYGTTESGGTNRKGTVFEVAAGTHVLTTLATFNGSNGSYPEAGLIADACGNLYGTTSEGGANGVGTVFKVDTGTHILTTLATFNGSNGAYPRAGLIADASGNLYGTTMNGGINNNNCGIVFELSNTGFAVPEPASLALLALGLSGMAARRRRGCR